MKRIAAVLLAVLMLNASAAPANAMMMELGEKIADQVLSLAFGEVFGSIFGGPQALTKEQLDKALDAHFDAFKEGSIHDAVLALKKETQLYFPSGSHDDRRDIIMNVLSRTSDLQAEIEREINGNNFFRLAPAYAFTVGLRLAYIAERINNDPPSDPKDAHRVLSEEATQGVEAYARMIRVYFAPPSRPKCVWVTRGQPLQMPAPYGGGVMLTKAEKNGCAPLGMLLPKQSGVFTFPHSEDQYFYMRRYDNKGDELQMVGPMHGHVRAEMERAFLAMGYYSKELSDPVNTLLAWGKVVNRLGDASKWNRVETAFTWVSLSSDSIVNNGLRLPR